MKGVRQLFGKRWVSMAIGFLSLALSSAGEPVDPPRVLILNPFGRDVEPFAATVSAFRSTLARELGEPVDIHEIPLDLARFTDPEGEDRLVDFLEDQIRNHPVDLVAPIGGSGAQFAARHRERLFPDTPVLVVAAEPRLVPPALLEKNTTLLAQRIVLPAAVEDILQMRPETRHIAVVFGSSPLERFWAGECLREFEPFSDRIEFLWLKDLSLDEMVERCSRLPSDSFIFHGLFLVDGIGVPVQKNEALRRLHESANAPIFAFFENEFGLGAIGGRLYYPSRIGTEGGRIAVRILRGEAPESIPPSVNSFGTPRYDWRELKRWKIDEARLPPDRIVEFREASLWEKYRGPVLGAILIASLQAFLIFRLLVNRAQRRRSEAEASLIADISSKFVNLPPHEVDREIIEAQRRLCEFLDIDLIALWQWEGRGSGHFVATHAYSLQAGPQPAAELREDDFPWCREQMLANRMVSFSSLDDLPKEAAQDREICRAIGLKSNLTIPLTVGGGPLVGVLGLNTIRRERTWPDAMVNRIQLVAQIFANAISRKRADQNLRESEMRLSLATESAEAGLWDLDLDTREFWTSQKAREIFEYSAEESIGMDRFRERVHPEDWERVREAIDQALTQGRLVDIEYRIRPGGKGDRWIVSRGRPLFKPNGKPDRVIGLSFDITEQRRREAETLELRNTLTHSARVTLLGQLASALAHELQPAPWGHSAECRSGGDHAARHRAGPGRDPGDRRRHPAGRSSRGTGHRAASLPAETPDRRAAIVRPSGRHRRGPIPHPAGCHDPAGPDRVRCRARSPLGDGRPDPPSAGSLEPDRECHGCVGGMSSRGSKNPHPGRGFGGRFRLGRSPGLGQRSGDSPGIDGSDLRTLFHLQIKRHGGGTAGFENPHRSAPGKTLGGERTGRRRLFLLYGAHRLRQHYRGEPWMNFPTTTPECSRKDAADPPMPTVFVVDDDGSFLRSITRLLRARGFSVAPYASAADFLRDLRPETSGCVITDLKMPGMDGLGLQEALHRKGNSLPVVFLTGQGDIPATVRAMRGGAEDFLTKDAPRRISSPR